MKLAATLRALTTLAVIATPIALPLAESGTAQAVVSPPNNATFYLQTNGPAANVGLGDWYTASPATTGGQDAGGGGGSHYLTFEVPCSWPAADPVDVDLYSPEINENAMVDGTYDEPGAANNYDTTGFTLFGPNAAITAGYDGQTGTQISTTDYPPADEGATEAWQRFAEIPAPVTCGTYLIKSVDGVGAGGNTALEDDQNGWKLRVGDDELGGTAMATGLQTPPADYDNPAGTVGDDQQITIGQVQTSYQGDFMGGGCQNQTFYHYVDPGQTSVTFHNFDFDDPSGSSADTITYFSPNGTQYAGTASGSTLWNNSGTPSTDRGTGDVIQSTATGYSSGWWRIVACVTNHNQYIVEADDGASTTPGTIYYPQQYTGATTPGQPPTPNLTVTKTDGQTVVDPGQVVSYTITLANTASGDTAGAATNIVATDTLPTNLTYTGCTLGTGVTGTCTKSGNSVIATLTDAIDAGANATITVTGTVSNTFPSGSTLANNVSVAYDDSLGQPYPTITASDTDSAASADLQLAKTHTGNFTVGTNGTYTLTVTNNGPSRADGVQVVDTLPAGESFVSGAGSGNTDWSCNPGTVNPDGTTPVTCLYTGGAFANAATSSIALTVSVGTAAYPGVTNTAAVSSTTSDPTPGNNSASDATTVVGATIGDFVFSDINDNGVQDTGDTGISGVTIDLLNSSGTQLATTVSGTNGAYSFAGLAGGTYSVEFVAPTGDVFSPTGKGTTATDSNPAPGTGVTPTFTIDNGGTDNTIDAGLVASASIAGVVFNDLNGNGTPDPDEGLTGETVTLSGTDDLGSPVTTTTTTAADGSYSFTGLRPGSYTVANSTPTGDTRDPDGPYGTSPVPVALTSGTNSTDTDFGYIMLSSLSGTVWTDSDADGLLDHGETGVTNVTVALSGTSTAGQTVTATTTSAASGAYSFTGLPPGNYTVTVTNPAGTLFTTEQVSGTNQTNDSDVNPTTGSTATLTLAAGSSDTNVDAGLVSPGSVSGTVFTDLNGNNTPDPGEGDGGVIVTLTGTTITGTPVTVTTTSNPDGTYTFTAVPPGNYQVSTPTPTGDSPVTGPDGVNPQPVTLTSGTAATASIGFVETDAQISGTVWIDSDADGLLDHSETGVNNVTVTLSTGATATTDASGDYSFTGLPAGNYTVTVTNPAGTLFTTEEVSGTNQTNDSDVNPTTGSTAALTLTAGGSDTNIDAGLVTPTTVTGAVFVDHNNNGVENGTDTGVPSATVTLTGTDDLGKPISITVTTANAGTYSIPNVRPGTYTVTETDPTYDPGKATAGTQGGTPATPPGDTITSIPLTGGVASGYNFGVRQAGSIAGSVYVDTNSNGAFNPGEPGIPNVTITLAGTDDNGQPVSQTTTTDNSGAYSFTNLRPGTYKITETQPASYGEGATTVGTVNGSTDGVGSTDAVTQISLSDGQAATGYLFGEQGGDVAGTVFDDETGSGSPTPGSGISGLTVTLTLPGGGTLTTTTANDGSYDFPGLPAGNYTVTVTAPNGYTLVDGTNPNAITVNPGQITTSNVGYLETNGVISGEVFNDLDADGLLDNADTPQPNVAVELRQGGQVLKSATTDNNGDYSFGQLPAGDYTVVVVAPDQELFTSENVSGTNTNNDSNVDPATGKSGTITLPGGGSATNVDAGLVTAGSIAGEVYLDNDRSGTLNGPDNGLGGVTVTLSGTNDLGHQVSTTTTTAGDGTYSFTGLRPGTYAVTETQPSGYSDGVSNPGSDGGTSTNADKLSGIVLTSGTTATDNDFGDDAAALSGVVFQDSNANGTPDPGEGLGGLIVTLTPSSGPAQTTTTAPDGSYIFTDLPAGPYLVSVPTPTGDDLTDGTSPVTESVPAGGDVTGVNFGYQPASADLAVTVSGPATVITGDKATYVVDVTNNGPDASVPTITDTLPAGSTLVSDTGNGWNCTQTGNQLTCVGASAPAGQKAPPLIITVTAGPAGTTVTDTASVAGSLPDPVTSNNNGSASTAVITAADVALSGVVYVDVDSSGTYGNGDRPIAGVTVTLSGTDDLGNSVSEQTKTQPDGTYAFTGLRPGSYVVTETQPTAYSEGTTSAGSDGGTVNANNNDEIDGVTLVAGDNAKNYDFGETGTTLSGVIYGDTNGDGAEDGSEAGIGGLVVQVKLPDGTILSTTTASDGSYSFTGLPAGSVLVTPSGPNGDVLTQGSDPQSETVTVGMPTTGVDFGYNSSSADLAITITGPANASAGDDIPYKIVVSNNGPDASGPLTVTLPVPSGATVVSAGGTNGWTCSPETDGVLTCTHASVGAGNSAPPLSVVLTDPTAGTITVSPTVNGTLPDPNLANNSASTSTTIAGPAPKPPHARDDSGMTKSGSPVGVSVLNNDSPQGKLTIQSYTQPGNGTVTCNKVTGKCIYTPNPGFVGTDTYTYTVVDANGQTSIATVTITVANRPPHAKPDHAKTPEGTPVLTPVVANDTDPEGQSVKVVKHTNGKHGTVSCSATTCTYIPNPGFVGTDTYTYTISDGHGGFSTTTVTVVVTDGAPVAVPDSGQTKNGVPITIPVTGNDTDPNGDPLTVIKHTNGKHGTVTCTAKTCTYAPDPGFVGIDHYTYTISDGHGKTSTTTVTLTVTGVLPIMKTRPPGGAPPSTTPPGTTPPSVTPRTGRPLPMTGAPVISELRWAVWLTMLGLLFLVGGRRRRRPRTGTAYSRHSPAL